jgi:hypothetical protein
MDTLEYRVEIRTDKDGNHTGYGRPPILWRGKSPQDVFREQYQAQSDRSYVLKPIKADRLSTRNDVHYCDQYRVEVHHREGKESRQQEGSFATATLIPLPERK